MNEMQVTIMFRGSFVGMDPWVCGPKTVTVPDVCPKCGGKRGTPYAYRFYEGGEWYTVQRWDNPCNHIDKYRDVYFEAQAYAHEKQQEMVLE